ncbi:MAG: hypothetical protein GX964_05080 [Syntrophomonadaceae bacterium]|jgi:hypothetical protein|nr:hypothetical protein [Syntrophomonadaceae bacterium]
MQTIDFLHKVLNHLYLGMSQVAERVPMGGAYWMEMSIAMMSQRIFNEYKQYFAPASGQAEDICLAWIDLLGQFGSVDNEAFGFKTINETVNISVESKECNYQDYCTTARGEGLPFVCPVLTGFKWITSYVTNRDYQLDMTAFPPNGTCAGAIFPAQRLKNILVKDGDHISIAGERAIVISTDAFGYLLKAIYEYAPHVLRQVLYESSYNSSLAEYDRIDPHYPNKRDLIEWLLRYPALLGVIRYEIVEFDEESKRACIHGYSSYLVDMYQQHELCLSPRISCHSARGRLAAYFTRAWGEDMTCEETRCQSMGSEFCEFIVLPTSS